MFDIAMKIYEEKKAFTMVILLCLTIKTNLTRFSFFKGGKSFLKVFFSVMTTLFALHFSAIDVLTKNVSYLFP